MIGRLNSPTVFYCICRPRLPRNKISGSQREGFHAPSSTSKNSATFNSGLVNQIQENAWDPNQVRALRKKSAKGLQCLLAGVTFEGRQAAVEALESNQVVRLQRCPWNQYDKQAVSVFTLAGDDLGFVPRYANSNFDQHEEIFGHVISAGPAQNGKFGAMIKCWPKRMDMTIDILPGSCDPTLDIIKVQVGDEKWNTLQKDGLRRSGGACALTGVHADELDGGTELVPEWQYDDSARVVRLARLHAVWKKVAEAKKALLESGPQYTEASEFLCKMNDWDEKSLKDYEGFIHRRKQRMDEEQWGVMDG